MLSVCCVGRLLLLPIMILRAVERRMVEWKWKWHWRRSWLLLLLLRMRMRWWWSDEAESGWMEGQQYYYYWQHY